MSKYAPILTIYTSYDKIRVDYAIILVIHLKIY